MAHTTDTLHQPAQDAFKSISWVARNPTEAVGIHVPMAVESDSVGLVAQFLSPTPSDLHCEAYYTINEGNLKGVQLIGIIYINSPLIIEVVIEQHFRTITDTLETFSVNFV